MVHTQQCSGANYSSVLMSPAFGQETICSVGIELGLAKFKACSFRPVLSLFIITSRYMELSRL